MTEGARTWNAFSEEYSAWKNLLPSRSSWTAAPSKEAKKLLLRQGQRRWGPPAEATRTALESVSDLERLERMSDRMFDVTNWQELLDTP